jgi:ribosomal protein S18 acetylase RimI-like enzyme
MDIRTAFPADLEGVRQYDRHIPVNRLSDCIRRGLVDVLVEDGRIVGVLRWSLFWQSLPFLDLIYLDESLRGQGWGTSMMAHWEKNMTAQGYQDVMLSTQSDENSKFFYEKLGYRRCGSFLPPDQAVEELMYRKELNKI